jgi:two-component system, response regulator PdtaR
MSTSAKIPTILVVEDDALVRMNGSDILEEAGFQVLEAETADDALVMLEDGAEVHLLFSDVDMPGHIDGMELARIVHERWPRICLLITSGHHRLQDGDVPEPGTFVSKPWTPETLTSQVRRLLHL